MTTEWDKLKEKWETFEEYDLRAIWAEGDRLQEEIKEQGFTIFQMEKDVERVEAIRNIVKIPDVWTHPNPIKAIREVME